MIDDLIQHTITRFPRLMTGDVDVQPLEKGGSDRKYFRIRVTDGPPIILVKYGEQLDENRHYVAIAQFLDAAGVRVPRIYFHDESEGLIWMEDLGEVDLWEHRFAPWPERRNLYFSALDLAALLHSQVQTAPALAALKLQKEFNAELYTWEQNYFFENCLERFFKLDADVVKSHRDNPALAEIAMGLAALPRVLVHRDFQSQNIMIKDGEAYLIDFQGLRPGLAQYDLASLLYDPYVALETSQREELLEGYMKKTGGVDAAGFRRLFDLCAMQRLMQALGAYGFLGLVKQRPHFLEHIPAAMASLEEVLQRIPGLEDLGSLITRAKANA